MLKLAKLGITGGLSCGKSTVCHLFKDLGAYVVSADKIVHDLLIPDNEIGKKIIQDFGPQILKDGKIDREKIAEIVFQDHAKLKKLESLLHPLVGQEIERAYNEAKNHGNLSLFVAEIPLLFESFMENQFDWVATVVADPEIAKKRFKGSESEFQRRSSRQMSLEEKMNKSNFILFNNGSLDELKSQVQNLFNQLKSHES